MKCRRCAEDEKVIKSSWILGKQRWHCKACQFHFVEQDERCKPESLYPKVVRLYCRDVSYNRSGKLKGISHTTARRWVSRYVEGLPEPPELESTVVELDEQCSFVEKKENKCWIWKAVDFETGRLLDWEIGRRTTATFHKLFQRLETLLHPILYCSDDWSAL